MDLPLPNIPGLSTEQVDDITGRVRTLYTHLVGGGLADLSRTPSEAVLVQPHTNVFHFLPEVDVRPDALPVLLIPPVNTASSTLDLRRGNSLAEFFMLGGRPTYRVDYGEISTRTKEDSKLGLDAWIDDILPTAITTVSDAHGG